MEANSVTAPRRGPLRTVIDRLRALRRRTDGVALPREDHPRLEHTVSAVDFLAHVDRDLKFLYVSDASLRFIGYHREYLQTITLHDLVAPGDVAKLDAVLAHAAASAAVEKITLELVKSLTYPVAVELRVARDRRPSQACAASRPPDRPVEPGCARARAAQRATASRYARLDRRAAAARYRRLSAREPRARLRRRRRDAARHGAAAAEHGEPGRDHRARRER